MISEIRNLQTKLVFTAEEEMAYKNYSIATVEQKNIFWSQVKVAYKMMVSKIEIK